MVMSSIKLNNLAKKKTSNERRNDSFEDYTYVDIHLDLQDDVLPNIMYLEGDNQTYNKRDIRISPDEEAIKNSLVNLFNTRPGQRILIPDYGTNLLGYVFEGITVINAKALGLELEQAIKRWEPRVRVLHINVLADPDNNEFHVSVEVAIPTLSRKNISFTGILSQEGFTETNTSRFI